MSYGPQLPPHLHKPRDDSEDSESEDQIGPKLPGEKIMFCYKDP